MNEAELETMILGIVVYSGNKGVPHMAIEKFYPGIMPVRVRRCIEKLILNGKAVFDDKFRFLATEKGRSSFLGDLPVEEQPQQEQRRFRWYDYKLQFDWSDEDMVYVGTLREFPSLKCHGKTVAETKEELRNLLCSVLNDMYEDGEPVPPPTLTANSTVDLRALSSKPLF